MGLLYAVTKDNFQYPWSDIIISILSHLSSVVVWRWKVFIIQTYADYHGKNDIAYPLRSPFNIFVREFISTSSLSLNIFIDLSES